MNDVYGAPYFYPQRDRYGHWQIVLAVGRGARRRVIDARPRLSCGFSTLKRVGMSEAASGQTDVIGQSRPLLLAKTLKTPVFVSPEITPNGFHYTRQLVFSQAGHCTISCQGCDRVALPVLLAFKHFQRSHRPATL